MQGVVLVKCSRLESENVNRVSTNAAMSIADLNVVATVEQTVLDLKHSVLLVGDTGESPLVRNGNVLATRELELGSAQSLNCDLLELRASSNREDDLADIDTSHHTTRLAEGTTHTGLQSIGTSAGQHLVDAQHVERVKADTQVERILAGELGQVLVHDDTTSFKSF